MSDSDNVANCVSSAHLPSSHFQIPMGVTIWVSESLSHHLSPSICAWLCSQHLWEVLSFVQLGQRWSYSGLGVFYISSLYHPSRFSKTPRWIPVMMDHEASFTQQLLGGIECQGRLFRCLLLWFSGCPQTCSVSESDIELLTPLPLLPECCDYSKVWTYLVLGIQLKTACTLGQHLPSQQWPRPWG